MSHPKIEALKEKITEMAQRINTPERYLPAYYSGHASQPFITFESGQYHLVGMSRAREKSRKTTDDEYLFLRWIFERATFEMAINIKREGLAEKNKKVVSIQQDLMAKIDKSWGA